MEHAIVYVLNLAAFVLILRWGEPIERWTVGVLVISIVLSDILSVVTIGTWRAGVAGTNLLLLIALWLVAMRANRYWIVLVTSAQLVAVLSHLLPVMTDSHLVGSGYILRRWLWLLQSAVFFLGAGEAWLAGRHARLTGGEDRLPVRLRRPQRLSSGQ